MGVIIVPFNYNEESNFSVVPICIGDIDPDGNPIHRAWVEQGVVPVADPLRKIASRVLSDVWRVSEITERAVHSLSRKHHGDLGDEPSLRILKRAHWYAEDLRAGGRRARRKTEVELFTAKLETLQDQFDLVSRLEAQDTLDRLKDAGPDQDGGESSASQHDGPLKALSGIRGQPVWFAAHPAGRLQLTGYAIDRRIVQQEWP